MPYPPHPLCTANALRALQNTTVDDAGCANGSDLKTTNPTSIAMLRARDASCSRQPNNQVKSPRLYSRLQAHTSLWPVSIQAPMELSHVRYYQLFPTQVINLLFICLPTSASAAVPALGM